MPRGGRRPGSGRPRKGAERRKLPPKKAAEIIAAAMAAKQQSTASPEVDASSADAKVFLERVMSGVVLPTNAQMDAARSLLPFQHPKLGEAGKKEQRKEAAGKVSRFAPAPPRMATPGVKKH